MPCGGTGGPAYPTGAIGVTGAGGAGGCTAAELGVGVVGPPDQRNRESGACAGGAAGGAAGAYAGGAGVLTSYDELDPSGW
jgi:hypothetical protein